MSDTFYPRIVIKKVGGEEIDALLMLPAIIYDLVTAIEFSEEDGDEMVQSLGSLDDLDADTLETLISQAQERATSLAIPFDNLLEEDDYPEVETES